MRWTIRRLWNVCCLAPLLCALNSLAAGAVAALDPAASPVVQLAAREVRRYVYLRTDELLPIGQDASGATIVLGVDAGLGAEQYRLKTGGGRLTISGGSPVAVLYGAYAFAEKLGVRFYLHGDVVPEGRVPLVLPSLDETHSPLFASRGLLPFHDFSEGPDWWEADDYKSCFSQMVKMRMNLMGLHCYPEGPAGPEPLVWIGHADDVDAGGKALFSSPSFWSSTANSSWGDIPVPTSRFAAGAGGLFEEDDFGSSVTRGHRPKPKTPEGCNEVFERSAALQRDVFNYGRELGVKICLGTETPLTIPGAVQERLRQKGLDPKRLETRQRVYEGMFTRIARAYPIDYYWLWTPESWTWHGASQAEIDATVGDIQTALAAWAAVGKPFGFGTCGWELGPKQDRGCFDRILPSEAVMGCINRNIGFNWVDREFAQIKSRPKWAIPWLEDDSVLVLPQLWAGRTRRDAADAHSYGCTGLLANHWRTKILAPNVTALATAAWSQDGWNPEVGKRVEVPELPTINVRVGGNASLTPAAILGTDEAPVYQTARYDLSAYRLSIPNGTYNVTLKFCENAYSAAGKRVFGVSVRGVPLAEKLDVVAVAGPNRAYDLTAKGVRVNDEKLNIDFRRIVENPFISGIVIEGMTDDFNQFKSQPYARRINCGGGAWGKYEADLPAVGELPPMPERTRDLPCADLYADLCSAWFGPEAAADMAGFFTKLDGDGGAFGVIQGRATLPRPTVWMYGPGGFVPIAAPWEQVSKDYAFVDTLAAIREKVRGAANVERFDYWLNTFRYMRSVAEVECARGALDAAMEKVKAQGDARKKKEVAAAEAVPARIRMARAWERMITFLLAATDTPGELGTIANLEQATRGAFKFVEGHDEALAGALGAALPATAAVSTVYEGPARIVVPTVRTQVAEGETLAIRVMVLDRQPVKSVTLFRRAMGKGEYVKTDLERLGRAVYRATIAVAAEDLEYYLEAETAAGNRLVWPAEAPGRGQTVVVCGNRPRK